MLSLQSFLRKGVSLGHVGRNYNLKDLKEFLGRLHWRAGSLRPVFTVETQRIANRPEIGPLINLLRSERKQGFSANPFYGRARCSLMLGSNLIAANIYETYDFGISDPICNENYYTIDLGRDRKFHVCSNFD